MAGETNDRRRQDDKLALEQLRLVLRNLKPNCWLMPAFAAVICLIFSRWISPAVLVFWFALVAVGGAYLGVVVYAFQRKQREPWEERRWARRAAIGYLLFATSWSSIGFLFWRHGDDQNQMLILLLIACTLAGNSALVGASKTLTVIGYSVLGFVLIAVPLRDGGPVYYGLSVLAFGYVCYLSYMSGQIYSTARDMLLLRDDKNELIEALACSKAESDSARVRAEAASRAKSEFLANMSHELRTPLNAILGFSEMIYSGPHGANRSVEYAKLVHQSGDHLLALVNDILDLAKIESGRFELRDKDLDAAHLIGETVRLMAGKAGSAGLALVMDVASDLPLVRADERALRQILINLLSNALKFTPAGGEVAVFARLANSGDVMLGVRDTGIGISADDQLRVFQSFGQGRHDVADKGTGLGLPIVKGLSEAHGGHVELESREGEGTCVTVMLPATRARPRLKNAS
ncbi:MAG TPA: HAMP domain-containing sensor histidine kinase [Rhizomicrobium sp.]|jgi:two-component system cell cycle sensor histidine kinase PleC|nr:HAMP domain-containing sensor histidine kinase [Rhizomicrobium sp.]